MVVLVSGFADIPDREVDYFGRKRDRDDYEACSRGLRELDVPVLLFRQRLDDCWMKKLVDASGPRPPPPAGGTLPKDSAEYCMVTQEKTAWLARAADAFPEADVLVWVDYGTIGYQGGVTREVVQSFANHAKGERAIAIPGCSREVAEPRDGLWWRFLGSSLVMHRSFARPFHEACVEAASKVLRETGRVEWEVKTWARVELAGTLPIQWYAASHDASQFDGYRP